MDQIPVEDHPLLLPGLFVTEFPDKLAQLSAAAEFERWFDLSAVTPFEPEADQRSIVRDTFRSASFKPTGRNKPASEYLVKAATEKRLSSINPAVDFCNIVSLHSGLPISVVDLDKTQGQLEIRMAPAETSYVFNASGQVIDVAGLICLFDEEGPCANAVKDSQRTKTDEFTARTLSIIWGSQKIPQRLQAALDWYQQLLSDFGASCLPVN